MRRRSKEGREPAKARRRKTATRMRRSAPKARRRSTAGTHQTALARVSRERDEALERQAAISDILRVISKSPSDVQPVLDSVAEHAAHICEARVVDIVIVHNEVFRIAASFGEAERLSREESIPLDRSTVTGRAIRDLQPVQVADLQNARRVTWWRRQVPSFANCARRVARTPAQSVSGADGAYGDHRR
jgi:hypothetical protein